MTSTLCILWLLLSIVTTAYILHKVGRKYGAHVAMSASTVVAVFMGTATVIGLIIGGVRWLVL